MYSPPPPEILRKLIGTTVELVGFGLYVMHLSLSARIRVSVYAPLRFAGEQELADAETWEFPRLCLSVTRCLGATVQDVSAEEDGTLHVSFDSGDGLVVYANDPSYEAYTIAVQGQEYVV